MIVLGIDPGTQRIGYGLIEFSNGNFKFKKAGLFLIKSKDDPNILLETKKYIDQLIKKYKPDILGIEKLFFARNQKTAMSVAQTRGVILLSAKENNILIKEYAPNEVKSMIAGYGFADKKTVLKMVGLTLGIRDFKIIDDASDALAIAIITASGSFENKISNNY
jgi:crossover junction endodeoxyribonuclease RuvC